MEEFAMVFGEGSERKQLERAMRDAGRLPPGQSATLKWPVLHEGTVPHFDPHTW
jgi:DMSO/TMAO reductase YedYZ molybdopterin-dependent catalytic subunit